MKKIGFLGLGAMGLPMAINLVKKGNAQVLGFDISKKQLDLFVQSGGVSTSDPNEIFSTCQIIFLCMPTNELLAENVEKIRLIASPNTIIIDLGSTSPSIIRELYSKLKKQSIDLIDSPVSGGEVGAINGSLVLMCGGDKKIFDSIKYLLDFLGTTVTYMGKSGSGSIAKLANNMIVACNIAAACEAFAFAVKAGLNPHTLFDAIKDGFAESKIMNIKIPKIMSGDFSASARVAVHMKDLKNAKRLAEEMKVDIPLSNEVLGFMEQLEHEGHINDDHCAIARIYEEKMNIKIR